MKKETINVVQCLCGENRRLKNIIKINGKLVQGDLYHYFNVCAEEQEGSDDLVGMGRY